MSSHFTSGKFLSIFFLITSPSSRAGQGNAKYGTAKAYSAGLPPELSSITLVVNYSLAAHKQSVAKVNALYIADSTTLIGVYRHLAIHRSGILSSMASRQLLPLARTFRSICSTSREYMLNACRQYAVSSAVDLL